MWSSATGNTTTTTTADTQPSATNPQPATLPPVPTNERLSFAVDQLTGSGQKGYQTLVDELTTVSYRDGMDAALKLNQIARKDEAPWTAPG